MFEIKKLSKNKNILVILLGSIIFLIVFLFFKDTLIRIDKKLIYDYYIPAKYNTYKDWNKVYKSEDYLKLEKTKKNIVIVSIDDESIQKINNNTWPFSREVYKKVFDNLTKRWAAVIGLDVILWNNWPDKKIDDEFASSIKKDWNIILGASIYNWNFVEFPIDKFKNSAVWVWIFNPKINKQTNTVYSTFLQLKLRNKKEKNRIEKLNIFALEIIKKYLNLKWDFKQTKTGLELFPWKKIIYSRPNNNEMLINFLKSKEFQTIPIVNVYNDDYSNIKVVDKDFFKDKIVIIWATAQWLKDTFNTPNGIDFWVYIHANIINTILSWEYLVYFNRYLELFLIFLLIIVSVYFNFIKNNKLVVLSNLAILFLFIFLPSLLLKSTNLILNYPSLIIISFILSITFSNIIKFIIENKNKNKVLGALSEYVSKDIAYKILQWSWWLKLDWEEKKVSIFFSDIAWFTSLSERMDAHALVGFLREYLGNMSDIIMDEKWFINKYEWDAIMALFWVFWYEQTSSYDNCKAALLQQERLDILNKKWQEQFGEILQVRMWIHTWKAIIWNIWSKWRKMEFTALWDSVNLASRLEWVNKFYNTNICVSEDVYNEVKDKFEFRKLDKIKVKWKNNALVIYELLSLKWELKQERKEIILEFEKALELYFKQEFKKAQNIFSKLWELWDKPSLVFARRCLKLEIQYTANSSKEWWDWVWKFDEK